VSELRLLPGGMKLVADTTSKIVLFVAGMGAGKTDAIAALALVRTLQNNGANTLVVMPIYSLIHTAFLPAFASVCARAGVSYVWHEQRKEITIHAPGSVGKIICRSAENPETLVGFEVGLTIVDEAARVPSEIHLAAIQRTRDARAPTRQIVYSTTPEGFNWIHELSLRDDVKVIRARTRDNPFLPPDYVEQMTRNLDEDDRRAYLDGEFVGKSGGVYRHFARATHCKPCANPLDGELIIGADFNVDAMSWVFMRKIGDEIHAFAELTDGGDTIEQAELAKELLHKLARTYSRNGETGHDLIRRTTIVPDASSASRKTSATMTDKDHMRKAGFAVVSAPSNPLVRDRVFSVNHAFRMGKLFIDGDKCPALVKCLEQQTYNKYGDPDKTSGLDHGVDALGYAVMRYMPSYSIRTMHRAQQLSKHNWSNAA